MQGQYARTSLNHACIDSLIHWIIDSLIHWFMDSLVHWFIHWRSIWETFGSHSGSHSGSHLGAIWGLGAEGASGRHLGSFWATTPQRNAHAAFNLQFYEAFLRDRSQSIVIYNISWWAAAANGSALQPRPLSNAVRTPQINLFGELYVIHMRYIKII